MGDDRGHPVSPPLLVLLALILLGASACSSGEVPSSPEPDESWMRGTVLYSSGGPDRWMRDLASGQDRRIDIEPGAGKLFATWTADGTRVAYGQGTDLVVADGDGSDAAPLVSGVDVLGIAWAPSGESLAAIISRGFTKPASIAVVDVASENVRELRSLGTIEWGTLSWAPDAGLVSLSGQIADHAPGVFVGSVEGGPFQRLVRGTGNEGAQFSPDGSWLLYSTSGRLAPDGTPACNEHAWKTWLTRPDGSEKRRLTDWRAFEQYAVWSPDGNWIALSSDRADDGIGASCDDRLDATTKVWVVRPDGTDADILMDASKVPLAWLADDPFE